MNIKIWSSRLLICVFLLAGISSLYSCHVVRFFVYNFADIRDYKKFHKDDIKKEGAAFIFSPKAANDSVKVPREVSVKKKKYDFKSFLKKTKSVAFVVIRNDTVLYQDYEHGYTEASIVPSFSMAKSFVSLLLGIAIDEGAVHSVNDKILTYLPELKAPGFERVTIKDLLNMESGIKYNEGYFNPFGDVAKYYYGTNIKKYVKQLKIAHAPEQGFEYKSVNTQLLGMIIEQAVHKSLADYMEEKVWRYIGAEYDASWSIDSKKDKEIKAFCCFNARPKDFAKLGRLYLNKGKWNGRQIVSEDWVNQSLNTEDKKDNFYSYQWWHTRDLNKDNKAVPANDFFADGFLGQYVYVYPEKHIIIVRLGKKEGFSGWPTLMKMIARAN